MIPARTSMCVRIYCAYGFHSHTLKVKNTLASSCTYIYFGVINSSSSTAVAVPLNLIYVSDIVTAYNNRPIKKLAEFQTFKIRMIRLRLVNFFKSAKHGGIIQILNFLLFGELNIRALCYEVTYMKFNSTATG